MPLTEYQEYGLFEGWNNGGTAEEVANWLDLPLEQVEHHFRLFAMEHGE